MPFDARLVEYQQNARFIGGGSYAQRTFIGAAPFVVREPDQVGVLLVEGTAIAWGAVFTPPAPFIEDAPLLERAEPRFERVDEIRWRTTWSYVMAVEPGYSVDFAAIGAWPTTPAFTAAPYT